LQHLATKTPSERLFACESGRAALTGGITGERSLSVKIARSGTFTAVKIPVHATFFQKVIICAVAGFLAASVIQWAKVFVEGADDALNKGYEHHAVMSSH
jgi:hypothetical protein